MGYKLLINAEHPLFAISRVYLDGEDVTDRGVVWVNLGEQSLCYKGKEGEVVYGKVEIGYLGTGVRFNKVVDYFPEVEPYIKQE